MYRTFTKGFAIALLLSAASFGQSGQSLGDIARANREKQSAQEASGVTPRVITNKDLPAAPPAVEEASSSQPMTTVSGVQRSFEGRASNQRFDEKSLAEQRAGEQWRSRIQEQQDRIAGIQARIDHLNASLHPAGSAQYEGPYNRYQAIQMERLAQMQEMLDQQTRRLSAMQEAARHAGMHTTVYDP
ncbi:MAG: hypothetical protein WCB05_24405 [Candidatus Sulfotelmatobacter sp.]